MDKEYLKECLDKGMSTRQISNECGLHHNTISYWITKYKLNNRGKYSKLPKYSLEKIDTKEKAYALGYILADASINEKNTVEFACAIEDKELLYFISDVINGHVILDYTLDKKNRRFPRARMTRMIKDIIKFTGGRLKKERHYPRIAEDLERYMLLGFFDGDGCITWGRRKDRNRIWQKITFTSQLKILEGVQKLLYRKLGISTVVRPKSDGDCYVLTFCEKNDVIKFCEYIYPNDDFIILNRKYIKYKALRLELEENGEGKNVS